MSAGKWKVYEAAKLGIVNGDVDLNSHSFKIALFLSTSNCNTLSGTTGIASLTDQVATANGYTQNSKAVTLTTANAGGTITVDETTNPVWTASGGPITARFAVIYDDTHASKQALCVCLLDSSDVTASNGNTFTITINASGLFTLSGGAVD